MNIIPRRWRQKSEDKVDIFVEAFPPTGEPEKSVPTPAPSPVVSLVDSKPVHVTEIGQSPSYSSESTPAVDRPSAIPAPMIQAAPPAETGFIPLGVAGFQFNVPKIEGKGEDADPVAVWQSPRGFLSVFDGMGGAGSTTYLHRGIPYSGAYIASRLAAEEVKSLFSPAFPLPSIPFDVREIKDRLSAALQREATTLESGAEPSRLKSKMLRRLPTTMAGILVELADGEVLCQTMWAGDSRCYALVPDQGLQQLTNDDLKVGGDALENLKSDSPLSNCLNADGDFEVRSQSAKFPLPAILLSATDGCFGYLFSPAHFEFLLLDTLVAAIDMGQWRDMIVDRLKTIAGDDCSLCLLAIGWASYTEMQSAFTDRRLELAQQYIEPLDELTQTISEDASLLRQVEDRKSAMEKRRETLRQELWTRYKPTHDHFLKRDVRAQEGADTL